MCGIIGIWTKNNLGKDQISHLISALPALQHRGPDHQECKMYSNCGLGHVRLSIIDTDERSNQPFVSDDGRYALVYNGEIYNYKSLRADLENDGVRFKTGSDTEVLLHLLIQKGEAALPLLNGFFAFAFYDSHADLLLLARDRMGIKPLYIYEDEDKLLFSSELQGFNKFDLERSIDRAAMNYYFGLTYIPGETSIYKQVKKLRPGWLAKLENGALKKEDYYPFKLKTNHVNYKESRAKLRQILTQSVTDRMVSDVPLGAFLSGGLDSSIIAALAKKQNPNLKTFSVGFDVEYFNETNYANEVAQKIESEHTVYLLTQDDFKENFTHFLAQVDEPFADSSAFAMYLLAKKTKEEVTVALSGDGADELFGGYRKHYAEYQIRKSGRFKTAGIKTATRFLGRSKTNRSDRWGDLNRKIQKLATGINQNPDQRYWDWCQFIDPEDREQLLKRDFIRTENPNKYGDWSDINTVLFADQELVLPNDMLKKVDLMSMASALEVRTPFLDHRVVEFANSLPAKYKINQKGGKQILKDTFGDLLPNSVLNRSKKGFEIPIREWLSDEIEVILKGHLFTKEYIEKQDLFNFGYIQQLRNDWFNPKFGDKIYLIWALVVFQHWWNRNHLSSLKID